MIQMEILGTFVIIWPRKSMTLNDRNDSNEFLIICLFYSYLFIYNNYSTEKHLNSNNMFRSKQIEFRVINIVSFRVNPMMVAFCE